MFTVKYIREVFCKCKSLHQSREKLSLNFTLLKKTIFGPKNKA